MTGRTRSDILQGGQLSWSRSGPLAYTTSKTCLYKVSDRETDSWHFQNFVSWCEKQEIERRMALVTAGNEWLCHRGPGSHGRADLQCGKVVRLEFPLSGSKRNDEEKGEGERKERQGEGTTEAETCQRNMSALANSIDSLIARGVHVSIDAGRVFKKLTAIFCVVTLINGVYFLVWSYLASYNGVHSVGYKEYKSRPWEPDLAADVTERNGIFYKGGLFYSKDSQSKVMTHELQDTFAIAQWYGIVVSLSLLLQFAACSSSVYYQLIMKELRRD